MIIDLEEQDYTVLDEDGYFMIDVVQVDLSKNEYYILKDPHSPNGRTLEGHKATRIDRDPFRKTVTIYK